MPVRDRHSFEPIYAGQPRWEIGRNAFAEGGVVESVEPSRYEVRPDPNDTSFADGGPRAWFVVARRAG